MNWHKELSNSILLECISYFLKKRKIVFYATCIPAECKKNII